MASWRGWYATTTAASPSNRATRTGWPMPSAPWPPIARWRERWDAAAVRCTNSASRRRLRSRRGRRCSVAKAWALGFGVLAIAYFAVRPSPSRGALPDDPRALAARVAAHPADWLAASALAEKALDMRVRDPRELWRVSGALASSLAPLLPEPRASLARGAFFHWSELTAGDRRWVLDAYAPLLRQVTTFETMELPLFSLTGDLAYLRRVGPPGPSTTLRLAQIAAINGLFADYRGLRAELPPQPRGNP